jgi:hypothetical protein
MILEAPDRISRRALVDALKGSKSYYRGFVHLLPMAKANKTLVYFQANRSPIKITDRGDVMHLTWRFEASSWENIDLEKPAGEVIKTLDKFFESRPKNL